MTNQNNKFDLEERTAIFAENVIDLVKTIPKNDVNSIIIIQLVKSATSIGANYCEADCAESKRDFEHKISISKKEAKEAKYWLRMLRKTSPQLLSEIDSLTWEARELCLIFVSIIKKSKINS
ncbi:MAG: hypothetical protein BWY19_00715 [bacterium ADurb.Bin212]|jgi:four helix bundle protein|nr:MAG: hypothetical protein BWY19_00715 [bacterium ADurb.Bin212]